MDGDSKKPLKIVITDFYKLHKAKGKEYTFKQFKKFGVHKATIYRWLKKIEQNGIVIVIKMFDHLKGWVHMANQNGLKSLQKIWNESIFMFVI